MSLRPDGSYRCDAVCGGTDVGNGGVLSAATVSDLDPHRPGEPRLLHLCRQPRADAPTGCAGLVLTPETLIDWTENMT